MEVDDIFRELCNTKHAKLEREIALNDTKLCIKIDAIRAEILLRTEASATALHLKTAEMEKRLHTLNEFRSEVMRDRDLLLRKDTYEQKVAYYDKFVADASQSLTRMETRYEGRITFATVMSVVAALAAILAVVVPLLLTHK